jgi:hypothetical protein
MPGLVSIKQACTSALRIVVLFVVSISSLVFFILMLFTITATKSKTMFLLLSQLLNYCSRPMQEKTTDPYLVFTPHRYTKIFRFSRESLKAIAMLNTSLDMLPKKTDSAGTLYYSLLFQM